MLDSTTGEVVKATLQHQGNLVREFYDHLPRPARVGIEALDPCSGLSTSWRNSESNAWWVIRQRFEQPNHENKSMIGEMRTNFYHF